MSITRNAAHDRLNEIAMMIRNSKFSIHDLSRNRSSEPNEFARFNMPFELGIDFGCFTYLKSRKDKSIAILDDTPHGYDQHTSDLSGRDIFVHNSDPDSIFEIIPAWLSRNTGLMYDSPKELKGFYSAWTLYYRSFLKDHKFNIKSGNKMDLWRFIKLLNTWLPGWKRENNYDDSGWKRN
ncbi:MAG: hypothetical protein H6581_01225 [Bacteroidia bacterium]|nr:hypothetical protein [Bacteroidia bacterium]